MDKKNTVSNKKVMRSDTEILKDLIDAVIEYNSLLSDESDFKELNPDPDLWGKETTEEFAGLSGDVVKARHDVEYLIREATGDEEFEF